ncbi:hypothetical protein SAMN05443252_105409 [Bacillus sp. OV322]|nr:hypothetical protein SAMN05443252_105409 [Bacillus sp. OV322]
MMVNNTLTTDRLVLRPFELVEDMEGICIDSCPA